MGVAVPRAPVGGWSPGPPHKFEAQILQPKKLIVNELVLRVPYLCL